MNRLDFIKTLAVGAGIAVTGNVFAAKPDKHDFTDDEITLVLCELALSATIVEWHDTKLVYMLPGMYDTSKMDSTIQREILIPLYNRIPQKRLSEIYTYRNIRYTELGITWYREINFSTHDELNKFNERLMRSYFINLLNIKSFT